MRTILLYILFIFLPLTFTSCSSRKIEKDKPPFEDPQVTSGREVFKFNCQKCHPNGKAGVGPDIYNIKLPKYLLHVRVRSRAFLLWTGKMPAFNEHEISKKELDDLIVYVKDMQKKKKP